MALQILIRKNQVSSKTKDKLTIPSIAHSLLASLATLSILIVMLATTKLEYTPMIVRIRKGIYNSNKIQ